MDIERLLAPFNDGKRAKDFSKSFVQTFSTPAFGAISKTEVDNLVFGLLVIARAINPKAQIYEIARDLNVTPAKARNLLFQWQLRSMGDSDALKADLIESLQSVRFTKDGDLMSFGVESPILREELRSRLKRLGIYPDASFSSEMVRVSVRHFAEFLDDFLDDSVKARLRDKLIQDRQLPDTSFKAIARGVLRGLAKKAVGQAGGQLVDLFGETVQGLLSGDSAAVEKAVKEIDTSDASLWT